MSLLWDYHFISYLRPDRKKILFIEIINLSKNQIYLFKNSVGAKRTLLDIPMSRRRCSQCEFQYSFIFFNVFSFFWTRRRSGGIPVNIGVICRWLGRRARSSPNWVVEIRVLLHWIEIKAHAIEIWMVRYRRVYMLKCVVCILCVFVRRVRRSGGVIFSIFSKVTRNNDGDNKKDIFVNVFSTFRLIIFFGIFGVTCNNIFYYLFIN